MTRSAAVARTPALPLAALLLLLLVLPAAALTPVAFEYRAPDAESVAVAGSFNGWSPVATPMRKEGDLFRATVHLPDGYHRYKFVIDGRAWVEDPNATEWDPAPKGTHQSLVHVGRRERFARDFRARPVVVRLPPVERIVALSDIHGTLGPFFDLLAQAGVAAGRPEDPRWVGGETALVLCGDFMDRGDESREVLDLIMTLERLAPESGGRVVALLGNHEHMRLVQADAFMDTAKSFERAGLDFRKAMGPDSPYGAWLRSLPLACLANGILFCHGGLDAASCATDPYCKATDPAVYERRAEAAIRAGRWGAAEFGRRTSLLHARDWWDDEVGVARSLKAWGAEVCVFGHTPGALGPEGKIARRGRKLVCIDTGFNPLYNHSRGAYLEIARDGAELVFSAHPLDAPAEPLFRRRAPRSSAAPRRPAHGGAAPARKVK